jgi:hypothetical protein
MINNHVDDINIQRYVLQDLNCDIDIIEHIRHCEICKIKAEQYKLLIAGIKQQEKPFFDFDLHELVLAQIVKPKPRCSLLMIVVYLLIFAGLISFGIVLYQFRISILNVFTGSSVLMITMVFLTVLSISLFQLIEFIKKYQLKMDALNF